MGMGHGYVVAGKVYVVTGKVYVVAGKVLPAFDIYTTRLNA